MPEGWTACHNPHRDLEISAGAYDAKCAACHSAAAKGTKASTRICKTGVSNCVTCHMPRYEVPGSHHAFADHWIRVAHPTDPYPN